jgi:uncharacterized membrane protein
MKFNPVLFGIIFGVCIFVIIVLILLIIPIAIGIVCYKKNSKMYSSSSITELMQD